MQLPTGLSKKISLVTKLQILVKIVASCSSPRNAYPCEISPPISQNPVRKIFFIFILVTKLQISVKMVASCSPPQNAYMGEISPSNSKGV
jgi:hypothetical protein